MNDGKNAKMQSESGRDVKWGAEKEREEVDRERGYSICMCRRTTVYYAGQRAASSNIYERFASDLKFVSILVGNVQTYTI